MNINPSIYHLVLFSVLILALVYLLVKTQSINLLRTKKLLSEKENALNQLEMQKAELAYREKNLLDSLIYAQRIQEALLPSEAYLKKHIEQSFIYFRPKDIVSGDFYWIGEKNNKVFIIAADCTGHGVPGALMSMIGLEIIGKTINENEIETPSKILDILNRGLEKTFTSGKNTDHIIKDGMDVGICIIDQTKRKMCFAGAYFPLYLIRNNNLIEIKGDKIVIGMNTDNLPYTDHDIDLFDDDMFYLFSDGYVDQFGGSENRKFMYRRFRYLLLNIHKFPIADQKAILDDNIRTWMGRNVQVDDMLIIGFRS
jgi:serine phosphatase RsbU (regulator of sigma subunit)